ncbi:helix-turn-helix transcriptional regulator [Micromonospora sp. NPDC000018]|uniref:helix-turn-helix domain-containing protein n=1 Tax=Micromonospora sp. NPDC000018 TaxID=3154239 RepID=UPI003326C54A
MAEAVGLHDIREARRRLGQQLAAFRKAAGHTQHSLAPLTLYGRSTIANAETGHQRPDRIFWQRCDEVLRTDGILTAGYNRIVALEREYRQARGTAATAAASDTAIETDAAITPTASGAPDDTFAQSGASCLHRRQALVAGITAIATAAGLLPGQRELRRIGAGDVARIQAVITLYRSVDYEYGGGAVHQQVAAFAETASTAVDGAPGDRFRQAALAAVAEARQLAGWTAFDAGQHCDAQRHFLSAERTAVAAGDARLAARIRYCQARQFQHLHHNRDAMDTLRLARDHLGAAATPAITAMLDSAEAASLAALGDHAQAQARLDSATEAYSRVEPGREPEWMGFFGYAEVLAQHGRVFRDMARHDPRYGEQAVRWTSEAIAAFGPQNVRSTVLNQIGLCSALFLAGEPDQALTVGASVLDHTRHLASARVTDRVHNLRRDLTHHAHRPAVREFRHAVIAVTA